MPDILHLNNSKVKFHVTVVFKEQKIDYLIDQSLSIETIIKNICLELNKTEVRIQDLSLRNFETEELITDENFRRKVKEGDHLKLVASPAIEAADTVRNMKSFDEGTVKRTIFMLQKYIKEVEFVDEFIVLGGLSYLQRTIMNCQGNTLAYALNSLQNLMEHDHGWENFTKDFVSMIVTIIVQQNLVNICRPATNIIVKLVCADKSSKGAVQCYGFDVVNKAIKSKEFLPTLVQRLSATDYLLQFNSLHLINALFRHVTDKHRENFVNELNELNIKSEIMKLMISSPAEELTKQLVEFQRLTIQEGNIKKNIQYSSDNPKHKTMLEELWTLSGLTQEGDMKWRKLGFSTENPRRDLFRIGFYGLEIIHKYATDENKRYRELMESEGKHSDGKGCPIMRAATEVIELLCDFWDINTGYTTTTSFQPFIFIIEKVFAITLECFIKLWHGSEINQNQTSEDLIRVSLLVRSQFRFSIAKSELCGAEALEQFSEDMLNTSYQIIKERHIKELELEDDLMSKVPIRHLRERLYKESYEFVKEQRINCLVQGAWFPIIKERGRVREMFRYYRLSPNTKCLHYAEYVKIKDTRPPIEELIEKIDLSTNMDIMAGSSLMVQHNKKNINSSLCFSLVGNRDSENSSHIDFICDSVVKYSEWIDGLNMFLDKNISSKSTAKYIQQLTDINLKLCLLELGSERVEIPVIPPEIPALPTDYQFFYEEGWCEAIDISDFEKNSTALGQSQDNLFSISNDNDDLNESTLNVSRRPKHEKNKLYNPLTVNTKHSNYMKDNIRNSFITPFTPVMNIVQSVFDSNRYPNTSSVLSNTTSPLNYQDIIETPLPPMPPPLLNRSSSIKSSKQSISLGLNNNDIKESGENEMIDTDSIKNSNGPINGM
ncbi:hypothetical protein BCR36DRAFT_582317 [Piromyces finnis]|uniref:ELMO domain-containing protein n=1 Tax=Piromyces finnis TaxID=1754191 RepID=A0A1Y1VCR4_9FUNG|nr:hypothetical protein BCR36DRAFT_582317 [Piromyces finnis]|eukprot:ORX52908.1 hypothetical protein BCR36DRAFT_582317 [Piromyces finnis]